MICLTYVDIVIFVYIESMLQFEISMRKRERKWEKVRHSERLGENERVSERRSLSAV